MAVVLVVLIASGCTRDDRSTDAARNTIAGVDTADAAPQALTSTTRPFVEAPSPTIAAETATVEAEPPPETAVESSPSTDTADPTEPAELAGDADTSEEPAGDADTSEESPPDGWENGQDDGWGWDLTGWLIHRRLGSVESGCGSPFAVPGEIVELAAGGFAPNSDVSFTARGVMLPGTELDSIPAPPTVTADGEGFIEAPWTVPEAPPAREDPVPRAYVAEAIGVDASGETFVAQMVVPIVAYPGAPICAVADSAATTLGEPVRIPVLDNDVAPEGGSLDPVSVYPRPVAGGKLAVDAADGSLTFTPDPGFAGIATTTYVVYDNWQIGVEGEVTVTVDVECTINIPPDAREIVGTEGDDVICADDLGETSGFDRDRFHAIYALGGDDIILGSNGTDWIYAGEGTDTVYARAGDDRIVVYGGDKVYGGAGYDTVYSAGLAMEVIDDEGGYHIELSPVILFEHVAPIAVDDHQHVDSFATQVIEVLDNDYDPNGDLEPLTLSITEPPTLGSARVVDSVWLGLAVEYTAGTAAGADELSYSVCDFLKGCTVARVHLTVGLDHCTITGTEGPDTLRGTPGDDVVCGLGGDDRIEGLGGNDLIIAGPGDDTVLGGAGDDRIWGDDGDDTLKGGDGDDTLRGGNGMDDLDGGDGNDILLGGDGDDRGVGGAGNDRIWGGRGNDTLEGGPGDDTLWGGPHNDTLEGGPGDDTLWGDASYGVGDDTIDGGDGDDILLGDYGRDTLRGRAGNDSIRGGLSDDTIQGGSGDDELLGGGGDDHLEGEAGDDRIWGGPGTDFLDGGDGNDYLADRDGDICLNGEIIAECEALSAEAEER